jgi:hypothetical protein
MNPLPFPIVIGSPYEADDLVEDPRVHALAMLCVCGHDLGDHYVEEPHKCEGVAFVEGLRASVQAVLHGWPTCPCPGFKSERAKEGGV